MRLTENESAQIRPAKNVVAPPVFRTTCWRQAGCKAADTIPSNGFG